MAKDYYEILGVSRSASHDEIKSAYKKLAKKYHPDINNAADATDKFKEVNEAAAVLGNPEKRQHYDRYGTTEGQAGPDVSGFDFSGFGDFEDIFSMFTGMGRRRGPSRGSDLLYDMDIELEEVAKGITKEIKVRKQSVCEDCKGRGTKDPDSVERCDDCGGSGVVRQTRRTPFGIFATTAPCGKCRGEGTVISDPCSGCNGSGSAERTSTIDVKIPAGVEDGMRLRVAGQGAAGQRGMPPGDLYVVIHVRDHDVFEREGDDVLASANVSFGQASLGAEIEVATLDGKAKLKVPAGTQPGTLLRMRGYGIPHLRGSGKGDQLVRVDLVVPTHLSKKQKELIEQLEGISSKKKGWLGL